MAASTRPGSGRWRRRLDTIRLRQTVLATAVVGLGLAAGSVMILVLVRRSLLVNAQHQADQRARDTAALLRLGPLPAQLPPAGEDEGVVQVVDRQGRVVSASAELRGAAPLLSTWPGREPLAVTVRQVPVGDGGDYRVVGLGVEDGTRSLAVYATGSALAVAVPLLLGCVAVTSRRLVGRSLRPVEAIRAEVAAITAAELDRRVPEPAGQDEVGQLARTMNTMLDRLQRAQERSGGSSATPRTSCAARSRRSGPGSRSAWRIPGRPTGRCSPGTCTGRATGWAGWSTNCWRCPRRAATRPGPGSSRSTSTRSSCPSSTCCGPAARCRSTWPGSPRSGCPAGPSSCG